MIEKKIAIITLHDINPSCAEKLQLITDELNCHSLNWINCNNKDKTIKAMTIKLSQIIKYYILNK